MTQYQKLQQVVNEPKLYKVQRNSRLYIDIKVLAEYGETHTYTVRRSGGYTNIYDSTEKIIGILETLKIAYEIGNDAPRGGKEGRFIRLTGKAIIKDIANARREREEAEKEEMRRAKAEKEAKRREKARRKQLARQGKI